MIERLSPRTRKVELFGRPHNVQPNWITLGNQLDGVRLIEPDVVRRFRQRYPNGYTMTSSNQQQHHQDMKTSVNHQQTNSK
jgi:mRNA (2'-O-methyladenosine-N6-)-methyltransferase